MTTRYFLVQTDCRIASAHMLNVVTLFGDTTVAELSAEVAARLIDPIAHRPPPAITPEQWRALDAITRWYAVQEAPRPELAARLIQDMDKGEAQA